MTASAAARDLCAFVDASPTPFHAVHTARERLVAAGFRALDERDAWELAAGDKVFVTRGDATLAAVIVGGAAPDAAGFRLVGAHTDSPNLRLKPSPVTTRAGVHQLGVEPYGGVLLHTWLDRDLSLAGRVFVRDGAGAPQPKLLRIARPLARVASLAIHLNRNVNADGLVLNPQLHLAPIAGLEASGALELRALVGGELGVPAADVLGFDLCLYDVQPCAVGGVSEELVFAPRLDNLGSCHAALSALVAASQAPSDATRGIVLFDHEEIGSRSAQGAASSFLRTLLTRVVAATCAGRRDALERAVARSFFVSADMAHAVHPNYAEKHEPGHAPLLGRGPVIKSNVEQRYATDGESWSAFDALCRRAGVVPQLFVTRSDVGCGSTIGPITAAELGLRTVDVGSPMLSMHSAREACAAADVQPMIDVLRAHFA